MEEKEKKLSAEQLAEFVAHNLAINLAQCAVLEAQAGLEIFQAQLKRTQAKAGVFRSHLAAEFAIRDTDSIDTETGVITHATEPAKPATK